MTPGIEPEGKVGTGSHAPVGFDAQADGDFAPHVVTDVATGFVTGVASGIAPSLASGRESGGHSGRPSGLSSSSSAETAAGPVIYKMRCPRCQKLYSVQASVVRTATESLQFSCLSCQTRFAVPLQPTEFSPTGDFVETFEIERLPGSPVIPDRAVIAKAPLATELRCPKCRALNAARATECRSCGVIFSKYQPDSMREESTIADISLAGRHDLAEFWNRVMEDYSNQSLHNEFLSRCYSASCLPFASMQYSRILSVSPTEEIAISMRQRIIGLASFGTEVASDRAIWNVRIPKMTDLILVLAGACIMMGLLLPHQKTLVAVGLIGITTALGVRLFLRRKF